MKPVLTVLFAVLLFAWAPTASAQEPPDSDDEEESTEHAVVLGAMPREDIDRVILKHLSAVRTCYEGEAATAPLLAGKVAVRFVIGKDGSVTSARVSSSTLRNEAVEQCVVKAFTPMVFPAPPGGTTVIATYPFVFRSGATVTLEAGDVVVDGDVADALIHKGVAEQRAAFQDCYNWEVTWGNPGAAGRMVVQFYIGTDGRAVRPSVAGGTLKDASLRQCIFTALGALQFPRSDETVTVRYAFVFSQDFNATLLAGNQRRSAVNRVIERELGTLAACYKEQAAVRPELAGAVVVEFAISATGSVLKAETARSTLNDVDTERCLLGHFLTMRFPEAKGESYASYPLVFAPH